MSKNWRDDVKMRLSAASFTEEENVTIFMRTLPSTYYGRLISQTNASIPNLVQTGERNEDVFKTGKIKHYQALFDQIFPNKNLSQ